jgi:peptidoglycan/LPS O-acetylase OafA/YrhL
MDCVDSHSLALFIPSPSLVFHYLFVFMAGMIVFQYFVGMLSLPVFAVALSSLELGCYATLGATVAGVALATALTIAFVRRDLPVLGLLGTTSYSLYLVHVPVGERILELGLGHLQGGAALGAGCHVGSHHRRRHTPLPAGGEAGATVVQCDRVS